MGAFNTIKLNIHLGGEVELKDGSFNYIGGIEKTELETNPDLLTWSVLDEFCKKNGFSGVMKQVWYNLPHDDIASARDGGLRELCREAIVSGVADVYLQQGVSQPEPFPLSNTREYDIDENEESGEEAPVEGEEEEEAHVDHEEEDPVEEQAHVDPCFEAFFEEVHNEAVGEEASEGSAKAAAPNDEHMVRDINGSDEDDFECERQCRDADHPEPLINSDDEWGMFNDRE